MDDKIKKLMSEKIKNIEDNLTALKMDYKELSKQETRANYIIIRKRSKNIREANNDIFKLCGNQNRERKEKRKKNPLNNIIKKKYNIKKQGKKSLKNEENNNDTLDDVLSI